MLDEHWFLKKVRGLPPEQQQRVVEFVENITHGEKTIPPRRDLMGLCSDLRQSISDETITETRQEMWSGFPRRDI